MAFRLGDIIIERLQYGYAESLDENATPLYTLTQLKETSINVTGESIDVLDADGNLVKKVWKAKTGNIEGTNAFINTNILAAASGTDPIVASTGSAVVMPRIITVPKGTTTVTLTGAKTGTVKVNALSGDGSLGKAYESGVAASETEFQVGEGGQLTLPTDNTAEQFIVKYDRDVTDGVKIQNKANEFPKSVRLFFKAVYFDPCNKNTLKGCYIEIPSFQISPEINLPLQTEAEMNFNGDLEIDYCSVDKTLYNVYFPNDEE